MIFSNAADGNSFSRHTYLQGVNPACSMVALLLPPPEGLLQNYKHLLYKFLYGNLEDPLGIQGLSRIALKKE